MVAVVGIAIGSVLVVKLLVSIFVYIWLIKKRQGRPKEKPKAGPLPNPPSLPLAFGSSKNMFTYEELAAATDGFSYANFLGEGGFGYVYKGVLSNGKEVAVKSLKAGSTQGDREFQAEVEIISRVHHRHLVSLIGYCIGDSRRMLVYDFVPNNNLAYHLHGKGQPTMDWPTRLKIALGTARGLAYLHEDCDPKIIHRDIKAANILLDFNFQAKLADFGLAKIWHEAYTHITTRVMGTIGYLDPEYSLSGKLTEKSDVFSFGVVLLELITGHQPVGPTKAYAANSLVEWARPLLTRALKDDNFDSLVNQRLLNSYNLNEMARMVACAAACVRHSAPRRPQMGLIVRVLQGEVSISDLNDGVIPGYSMGYGPQGSSGRESGEFNKLMQVEFANPDRGSSEYGGTISDNVYPASSSSYGQPSRELETRTKGENRGFSGSTDMSGDNRV